MFRIDRSLVNLSAARSVQAIKTDNEAGAAGIHPEAAASTTSTADIVMARADEIISEAEAKAREKAESIIENARDEAARLLVEARDEADEIKRRAWQEGFEQGSGEGRRSFDEQLEAKLKEDDDMVKNALREIHGEREQLLNGLEKEVVGLAMSIVRKILNPDEDEAGVFMLQIKNALRRVNMEGKIIIRVSPNEYERFFASGNKVFELDKGLAVTASILRDLSLTSGDLIIDTIDATVDAGLESQMKYIELAFERTVGN